LSFWDSHKIKVDLSAQMNCQVIIPGEETTLQSLDLLLFKQKC